MVNIEKIPCICPWTDFQARVDGTIAPCCRFVKSFGNITQTTVFGAWNSDVARETRAAIYEKGYICGQFCGMGNMVYLKDAVPNVIQSLIGDGGTYGRYAHVNWGKGPSQEFWDNRAKILEHMLRRDTVLSTSPMRFSLILDSICNVKCVFCFQKRPARDVVRTAARRLTNYIIRQRNKIWLVALSGGEPTFAKPQREFMRQAAEVKAPFCVHITTNAQIRPPELERLNLWSVNVSVNACRKEEYERVMRGAVWEKALENIRWYKNRVGNRLRLSYVVMADSYHDVPAAVHFWNVEQGIDINFSPVNTRLGSVRSVHAVNTPCDDPEAEMRKREATIRAAYEQAILPMSKRSLKRFLRSLGNDRMRLDKQYEKGLRDERRHKEKKDETAANAPVGE